MAILAGDALLNRAYEVMFDALATLPSGESDLLANGVKAARLVARAAGALGMVGGQVLDMEGELASLERGQAMGTASLEHEGAGDGDALASLERMHALKTGALIKASVEVPAVLCGLQGPEWEALDIYASQLGLAFQIRDDLLDLQGTEAELGKPIGSDARNGKRTFVSLLGEQGAKEALERVTWRAMDALHPFGNRAHFLKELARYVSIRSR
jgi:geranylgeranyl diphosphate synthase type II